MADSIRVAGQAQNAADGTCIFPGRRGYAAQNHLDFAHDFVNFLLEPNVSIDEKKNEIRAYIDVSFFVHSERLYRSSLIWRQKLSRNERAAGNMVEDFHTLRQNVNDISDEWQQAIGEDNRERLIHRDQIDQRLQVLEKTAEEYGFVTSSK